MQNSSEEYQDTLGPHKQSLDNALSEIADIVKAASDPASSVAERLNEVADGYDEIIGNDPFASGK